MFIPLTLWWSMGKLSQEQNDVGSLVNYMRLAFLQLICVSVFVSLNVTSGHDRVFVYALQSDTDGYFVSQLASYGERGRDGEREGEKREREREKEKAAQVQ